MNNVIVSCLNEAHMFISKRKKKIVYIIIKNNSGEEHDVEHDMASECSNGNGNGMAPNMLKIRGSPDATLECNTTLPSSLQESQPTNLHIEMCKLCVK